MIKRAITAILLVGFVIMMVYFGASNYIFLDVLVLAFALVGTYEIYRSFKKAEYKNSILPLLLLLLAYYPAWHFLGFRGGAVVLAAAVLLAMAEFTFKRDAGINDLTATIFTLIYPFAILTLAFDLTKNYACGGVFAVTFAVFLPVFADTFAYLVGSTLKGPKLCPEISPKKTISGAVGGVLGSMICAVVFFLLFDAYGVIRAGYHPFTDNVGVAVAVYLVLGLVGGVIAEIGDLAASRIKRAIGIKDFGNIFPGHGGVLDRLDSILFTLVMLYFAFQFMY